MTANLQVKLDEELMHHGLKEDKDPERALTNDKRNPRLIQSDVSWRREDAGTCGKLKRKLFC